jgi:hypothetical protein
MFVKVPFAYMRLHTPTKSRLDTVSCVKNGFGIAKLEIFCIVRMQNMPWLCRNMIAWCDVSKGETAMAIG